MARGKSPRSVVLVAVAGCAYIRAKLPYGIAPFATCEIAQIRLSREVCYRSGYRAAESYEIYIYIYVHVCVCVEVRAAYFVELQRRSVSTVEDQKGVAFALNCWALRPSVSRRSICFVYSRGREKNSSPSVRTQEVHGRPVTGGRTFSSTDSLFFEFFVADSTLSMMHSSN